MRDGLTEIALIVDKSGSMMGLVNDTIGGFNRFIKEQKEVPGEALVTINLFDTYQKIIAEAVPIGHVADLTERTYMPGGSTALLDAIGDTITRIGSRLANTPERERPSLVIVTIITDGEENSSNHWKYDQIKKLVQQQQDVYKWQFLFFGANMDAISTGESIGVPRTSSFSYDATPEDVDRVYALASANNAASRMSINSH